MNKDLLRASIDESSAEHRDRLLTGAWWHSIRLGHGQLTPGVHSLEELEDNYRSLALLEDLSGRRILDIGCWDGFYSFEAERHGASVVAVDCWRPQNFLAAHKALNSSVEFREHSVYELNRSQLGAFDIVLFLGVLYHLRHPLLGLERVCELTRDEALIETHVIDNIFPTSHPVMEFYEFDELGGQYDNWWGPNTDSLIRMLRAAGFARCEVLRHQPTRTLVKAYRRWKTDGLEWSSKLRVVDVTNAVTSDSELPSRGRNAFLALWVDGLPETVTRETVQVEVGGFGIKPYFTGRLDEPVGRTQINTMVPPGLDPGEVAVRVIFEGKVSSEKVVNFVDGDQW